MTTPATTLTTPPTPPSRSDPTNFASRGDAFMAWFPTGWSEITAVINWITDRCNEIFANSLAATQAATIAQAAATNPAVVNAASNASAAQLAATQAQGFAAQAQAVSPDSPVRLNTNRITSNLSIPTGYNAASAGPITVDDGVTVTISDHSTWSIT